MAMDKLSKLWLKNWLDERKTGANKRFVNAGARVG
jgi:hypothetical protein